MKEPFTIKNLLPRGSALIFILSFLLPFISVQGCKTGKITTYSGQEIIQIAYGSLYYLAILCILVASGLTFLRRGKSLTRDAFVFAWQGFLASFAGLIVLLLPQLQFLFDSVLPDIGGWACIGSSCIIFIWGESNALRIIYQLYNETLVHQNNMKCTGWSCRLHQMLLFMSILSAPLILLYNIKDLAEALPSIICISSPLMVIEMSALLGARKGEMWVRIWNRIIIVTAVLSFFGFLLIILTGG